MPEVADFMSTADRPIANPLTVLREEFDDWALLFDPDSGKVVGLNPVSVFIWKLLDGNHTEAEILVALRDHFEKVPEEADQHLKEFVQGLVERGFVGYELQMK